MKIILELSEKDIQIKLDELIGKRVSEITNDYIEQKAAAIVHNVLARLKPEDLAREAARKLFVDGYGDPNSTYNNKYGSILREEATKILEHRIDLRGIKA